MHMIYLILLWNFRSQGLFLLKLLRNFIFKQPRTMVIGYLGGSKQAVVSSNNECLYDYYVGLQVLVLIKCGL